MCRETASQSQKVPDRINSLLNLWLWVQIHMPWISLQAKKGKDRWAYTAPFPAGSLLSTRTEGEKEHHDTKALTDV